MTLVETYPSETVADFRAALDAILQAVCPERPNWWHPYEVRGTYECRGVRFREFCCIAGSVHGWLWMNASRAGVRRVILLPARSLRVFGGVTMVGCGVEVLVAPAEVKAVQPPG
jgi:hypothetical protein